MSIARTLALVTLFIAGCAAEERAPLGSGAGEARPPTATEAVGPCIDGQERTCRNVIPGDNGIVDCFESVSRCIGGQWTACGETELPAAKTASRRTCAIESLSVSLARVSSAATPPAFARAWYELLDGKPAVLVQLEGLDRAPRVAVGASNGQLPPAFSPHVSRPPTFDVALGEAQTIALDRRAVTLRLRVGRDEIPVVSLSLDGRLSSECDRAESLTVTMMVPESARGWALGDTTIGAAMGEVQVIDGVRGWPLVLELAAEGT